MLADVQQARQQADIVLVAFRWGISWGYGHILGYQKELGRAAIEAGADLIMGAHPLNVMGMEMYKGKLLCYSMGNFVMDGQKLDHFGSDTIIVKCRVENKRITKYSLYPGSDQQCMATASFKSRRRRCIDEKGGVDVRGIRYHVRDGERRNCDRRSQARHSGGATRI